MTNGIEGMAATPASRARDAAIVADGRRAVDVRDRVWTHARSEYLSSIDTVMTTVAEGPLVYAVPEGRAINAFSSHEDVVAHYHAVYSSIEVQDWRPAVELATGWYVFFDGVVRFLDRADGQIKHMQSALLFPMDDGPGIRGETVWNRVLGPEAPDAPIDGIRREIAIRDANRTLFLRYLAALKQGDAAGVAATFASTAELTTRSHADPAGVAVKHGGRAEIAGFYQQVLDRFSIRDIVPIQTVASDWYVFAELHWRVTERRTGRTFRLHTADMLGVLDPGLFVAQIGWATDLVPDEA